MKNTLIFLITLSLCLSETKGTQSKLDTTFQHVIKDLHNLIQQNDVKTIYSLNLSCNKNKTCHTSFTVFLDQLNKDLGNIKGLSEASTVILNKIKKNVKEINNSPQFDDVMRAKKVSRIRCCKKHGCPLDCYLRDLQSIYRITTFPSEQR